MPQFENIEVSINNNLILSNMVTINEENSLNPDYILGSFSPVDLTPTDNKKVTFEIDYIVETNNEPNYQVVQQLINGLFIINPPNNIFQPSVLIVGGITGYGYLDSYDLKINPNQIISASIKYVSYTGLLGNFIEQPSNVATGYDLLNYTGLAHYWSSQAVFQDTGNNILTTGSVIELDYSFKANWNPIYQIGNQYPIQVILADMQEKFDIVSEVITNTSYTGNNAYSVFNNYNSFNINSIGFLFQNSPQYSFSLNMAGGILTSNKINIKTDELLTIENSVIKYY